MKTTFLFLSLLLGSVYSHAQWSQYQNLDFSQTAKDSLTQKSFWQSKDFIKLTPAFQNEEKKENPCLKISGEYSMQKPGYVYQQHPVKVEAPTLLKISASIKGENIEHGNGSIYAYTKNGEKRLGYHRPYNTAIVGTEDWRPISLYIWVEPEADMLRIGGSLSAKGSLWVDDFKIEPVDTDDCQFDTTHLAFMEEVMGVIENYSLYKDSIDTDELMNEWKRLATCQDTKDAITSKLSTILRSIDNHSFYMSADRVNSWQSTSSNENADIPLSRGHHIDQQTAYIWMPYFGSGDSITIVMFATEMQKVIDSLDNKNIKAWVLDLRDNEGGNCWPMLAGIGPILGEAVCGYFQGHEGNSEWYYRDGGSYFQTNLMTQIDGEPHKVHYENPFVAVLTGPGTSSSGEVVTVSFKNRPNTKIFGEKTGGYTTGNANHTLSDGSMIFLAQSVYADRDKNAYLHGVEPDVYVKPDADTEADEVLDAAVGWLREKID